MREINGKTITSETVALDDTYFIECKLEGCTLIYLGGDFGWTDTTFENCLVKLDGPAYRSLVFINTFGGIVKEYAESYKLTPVEDEQRKTLLAEVERARETLLEIKNLQHVEASYYTYTERVKGMINKYFNPKSAGKSEGKAQ